MRSRATLPWNDDPRCRPSTRAAIRGAPIVAAFEAGVGALDPGAEIIVKLDADVSFGQDFFERIVRAFDDDSSLGIAGGTCYEQTRRSVAPHASRRAITCAARRARTGPRASRR